MATRTPTRSSATTSSSRKTTASTRKPVASTRKPAASGTAKSDDRSAFSFGDGAGPVIGPVIGAALAGLVVGMAANYGRKALMQGMEAMVGDWDEILAAEHELALALFDKMLATDSSQTFKRKMLLTKLTHALDKHAHQEEMVVYPALREAGIRVEADQLEADHGEVKTFLYELNRMSADSPNWLETVREFRSAISRHMHMEEEQVFPSFKQGLTGQQNGRITSLVNRDGFWMA